MKKKIVIATVAILAIAGTAFGITAMQGGGGKDKKDAKKDQKVTLEFTPADVAVVEVRELTRSIAFSGSLSPVVQTTVKAKVAGDINKVFVREGETVAQGQPLAQIDTADHQARLDSAAALHAESKAKLSIAEKNRENNQALLKQKFISQNAYDTTNSTYEGAAASVRSAEAQLRIAQRAMDDAAVRAPFAGIVSKKIVNPGEKVAIDSPLFGLVDLGRMEIEAPAPASEIPSVKPGQAVTFRVDGFDRTFEGRVERINPTTEANSRAIMLYISVANRDGALKGGMFAKGQIVLDKTQPAALIPATAVRDEAGQSYVFTIEDGKIVKRAVKVGATETQQGLIEVKSGLERGQNVVSARVSGLKDGQPAIMKPAMAKPSENAKTPKAG
ncbi:efflux RND transporter periplasmic adaptor subunit [Usitatibacter palustris]|nr:efflux RND transporter periplasmic adaptor subunit [Usitatibacter palustris]